jgi:hypothetical protein
MNNSMCQAEMWERAQGRLFGHIVGDLLELTEKRTGNCEEEL